MTRREASARRALFREHKQQLRRGGELIDSRDALVTGGLYQELEARGWNRPWPPLPQQSRGRWPGSSQGRWPKSVCLRLPADLVHTVRAACWHTCSREIGLFYDWRDRHPKAVPTRPTRPQCEKAALEEYEQLAAKVITHGEIWRMAISLGITSATTRYP